MRGRVLSRSGPTPQDRLGARATGREWTMESVRPGILGRLLRTMGFLGIAGLVAAPAAAAPGRRPNIVIILGDDMGFADMGSFWS